jgi:hypothetical protein
LNSVICRQALPEALQPFVHDAGAVVGTQPPALQVPLQTVPAPHALDG